MNGETIAFIKALQNTSIEKLRSSGGNSDAGKVVVVDENGNMKTVTLPVGQGEIGLDSSLSVSGAAADAKVVGDAITSLNGSLEQYEELSNSMLYRIDGAVNSYGNPYTGKRINADGIYVTDSEYQVLRYPLSELTYLKIHSDDRFVFQNSTLRPTTAPNSGLVGSVHGAGESIIKVPEGATNLYISTPIDGSTAVVEKVTPIVPILSNTIAEIGDYGITWEVGGINNQGGDSTNTAYSRTNYIPIGNVRDAFYYKLRTVTQLAICAVYDEGKNIISLVKTDSGSVVEVTGIYTPNVPNAYYIRFCSQTSNGYIPILHRVNGFSELTDKGVNLSKLGEDVVTRADGTNYIDYDALTERRYINASGVMVETSNIWVTDYIPIEAEKTYYQSNVHSSYYAFYDETKTFISGYDTLGNLGASFTTPTGAKYARFSLALSAFNYKNAWINDKNEMPAVYQLALNKDIKVYTGIGTDVSNPCDYTGEDITAFVKGICIGDSLTAGAFNTTTPTEGNQVYDKYSYPRSLERLTGVEITNAGHSGYSSAEWYQAYQNEDFSGHDFAIIQLGVNDQIRYGEFGDTSKTAFNNIISMLKTQNPKIKIFVANIIPALSYATQGYKTFSDALLSWIEAKHVTDADIVPLDIQQYGHTAESEAFNCGHLSAYGYNRLARDYKSYISWYMATNKMEFRQIQFIGTEYAY